jgi:K+ transporter
MPDYLLLALISCLIHIAALHAETYGVAITGLMCATSQARRILMKKPWKRRKKTLDVSSMPIVDVKFNIR